MQFHQTTTALIADCWLQVINQTTKIILLVKLILVDHSNDISEI